MRAYNTIEELYRIARAPEIDDDQLATLVAALESTDSYIDQEDGGYGSFWTRETEVSVAGSAECALREAAPKVLMRLVAWLAETQGAVREALLRVVAAVQAKAWATHDAKERAGALSILDRLAGDSSVPLATLAMSDDAMMSPEARARDLIALRLLTLDAAETDVERAVEPIVRVLLGPSRSGGKAACDAASFLSGSHTFASRLVDLILEPGRAAEPARLTAALEAANVRLDAGQRASLAAMLDDAVLGFELLVLLAPYLADPAAEAEMPMLPVLLPRIARRCAESTNEGTWRYGIERCGHATLAKAIIPLMRVELATGRIDEDQFRNLMLLGKLVSPLASDLVPYLDPARSPSARHVHWAAKLAAALASPVLVPALTALLKTRHQYEAVLALAAIGPPAAAALHGLEALSYVTSTRPAESVLEACANAIAKIRRGD